MDASLPSSIVNQWTNNRGPVNRLEHVTLVRVPYQLHLQLLVQWSFSWSQRIRLMSAQQHGRLTQVMDRHEQLFYRATQDTTKVWLSAVEKSLLAPAITM
jgi:hypothetical protein